jgi:tryptophan synthase alpha chain
VTRLEEICRAQRSAGAKALVPFLTAGFPDEATTLDLLAGCAERGCRVVEVGVPFSDPIADGPAIQQASQRALERGMTLTRALHLVRELADGGTAPVVMSYLNPILSLGFSAFADAAARAGCAGVIVPDLSVEESPELRDALAAAGLPLVDLVAPTTGADRLARIAPAAAGFLYLIAVAGVTGTRAASADDLAAFAARVRASSDVPLYIGFGIDGPDRAREAAAAADGVIVGSALVRRLLDNPDPRAGLASAIALVDELVAALAAPLRRFPS